MRVDPSLLVACVLIDHFTDTAAILNKLDLMSIMGFPGGISKSICYAQTVLLHHFQHYFS